jgi:hypothetical protein
MLREERVGVLLSLWREKERALPAEMMGNSRKMPLGWGTLP